MTTNPIAVLDVDDARELLRAIGCEMDTMNIPPPTQNRLFENSRDGFRIIGQLQTAVREAQARGEGA